MTAPAAPRVALDVHTFIGAYAHRELPHPDPDVLVRVLDREGIAEAWTGYLPAVLHRDPAPANAALHDRLAPHRARLHPTPVVRPNWPGWERELAAAVDSGCPAVRAYPPQWGMAPGDASLARLASACGDAGVALVLTVRFEDLRQRGPQDVAGDLSAAAVRQLARVSPTTRIVVLGAGREMIEEVHWGLTEREQRGVWWDFSWVWGPPEDHLAHLFRTVGAERFAFGTGWPLRLVQVPRANLDLLPDDVRDAPLGDPRGARDP